MSSMWVLACLPVELGPEPPENCDDVPSQNQYVYELLQEVYLWNESLPDTFSANAYDSPSAAMEALRNDPPDRWSRVSDKATEQALFEDARFLGYGFSSEPIGKTRVVISYVEPNSPAGRGGLKRGDELLELGGYAIADVIADDRWSDLLGPREEGVTVELAVQDEASKAGKRVITLTKAWIDLVTVPVSDVFDTPKGAIGYVLLQSFLGPTEDELNATFARFRKQNVARVVIDLRYNGGGLVNIAQQLIDLLIGDVYADQTAFTTKFNDDLASKNSSDVIEARKQSLPKMADIVFITSGSTASASELVINSLKPYVHVRLVGEQTYGKPVGAHQFEFCDKLAAPITIQLVNAEGDGSYFNGLAADCNVDDDLDHALGERDEARLAAALALLDGGACPTAAVADVHAGQRLEFHRRSPVDRSAPEPVQHLH